MLEITAEFFTSRQNQEVNSNTEKFSDTQYRDQMSEQIRSSAFALNRFRSSG
jgi:hypothetical protein